MRRSFIIGGASQKEFMMKFLYIPVIFLGTVLLSACNTAPDIQDPHVKERVIACSGGFSDTANLALGDIFDRTAYSNQLSAGFKLQARPIIFSEIPPQDRLATYQDYLKCIEEKWDTSKVNQHNENIKAKRLFQQKK